MNTNEFQDPIDRFNAWLTEAIANEGNENATAMCLSTIGNDGIPDSRMVLLKHADSLGFVFYTNLESQKGQQLKSQPKASLCFHWKGLGRQIRVRGIVKPVSNQEADEYFASRARQSQIGAWASKQSRPLEEPNSLQKRMAQFTEQFSNQQIQRPLHWSGFRILPLRIEFWLNKEFRLHDRLVYFRANEQANWQTESLYP
ncbi:MAG: pyridoxamine 5'-phosphate oxidase [Leptonema sp. (in: Bacteria)]|nr:pyridoxamine 5'-phosphate oxidase [Leptonema sp. (in: bacteria)]